MARLQVTEKVDPHCFIESKWSRKRLKQVIKREGSRILAPTDHLSTHQFSFDQGHQKKSNRNYCHQLFCFSALTQKFDVENGIEIIYPTFECRIEISAC